MTRSIPTTFLVVLGAAFAALQVVLGAASLDDSSEPGASVAAMAVYALLITATLIPSRRPLQTGAAWAAALGCLLITVLVDTGLPRGDWPGYAAWHPAALECLLTVTALRGKPRPAAVGCAVFVAVTVAWSLGTRGGLMEGLRISLAPVLFVATAIALAQFLTVNDRRAESKTRQALALLDEAARARAHTVEAAGWVREVKDLAASSLSLAADPQRTLTEAQRHRMLEAEAALRDRVRGGALAAGEVLGAVAAARSKGVAVHLLDDRGAVIGRQEMAGLVDALRGLIQGLDSPGTLTVRARPAGSGPSITVVFAPSGPGESAYIEV